MWKPIAMWHMPYYVDENWLHKLDRTSEPEAVMLEAVVDPKKIVD